MSESFDLRLTEPQVSVRLFTPMVESMEAEFGVDRVAEWVARAGLSRAYLADPRGWVSYAFVRAFERLFAQEVLGLDDVPGPDHPTWGRWRRMGRRVLTRDVAGPLWPAIATLGSPGTFYRTLPQLVSLGNRVAKFELASISKGAATLLLHQTAHETPAGCWIRVGVLEQVPAVWGHALATIEHPECLHRGADHCRYEVRWDASAQPRLVGGLLAALVATGTGVGASHVIGAERLAFWIGAVSGLGAFSAWAMKRWSDESGKRTREALDLRELMNGADERMQELWEERNELRLALLTNRKISGFLAGELVDEIMQNPERELELGGRTVEAAVLFADIVGFTPRCEAIPPDRILDDLNTWFGVADPIIQDHDGIIDKRIGDAIMIVFVERECETCDDVSRRAVRCALELLAAVEECNRLLAGRESPPFALRIGGAVGSLVLGNMGSALKLEYTVIGDVVNQAARLEGHAPPGHAAVLGVMADAAELGRRVAREQVSVKGKAEALDVVTLAVE